MDRRMMMRGGILLLAAAAVLVALLVFKVRIAVASGKYVVLLVAVLVGVWWLNRLLSSRR
jgi:hypothetical protein